MARRDGLPAAAAQTLTRRSWLRSSVFGPLAGGVAGACRSASPRRAPMPPRDRIRDRHFPNVELRTHENRVVRFYDDLIRNKTVVINFMYAECRGACPAITMNVGKVQRLLGDRVGRDIFLYSITLEPEHDTPRVLGDYAAMHGAGPGWTFLTGRPGDIERLRRSLGFVDPDPDTDRDRANHIGNLRYGNEPLMLWAACPAMGNATWIVESISWVMRPASA